MSTITKYILVDDDDFANFVSAMIIEDALGTVDINAFTYPNEGLDFIEKISTKSPDHSILFLDINMPRINGWEFLDQYEKFSEEVKMQIDIYMLTSSVDQRDKDRAEDNRNVKGFLSKPLDYKTIISLSEKVF